MTKQYLKGLRNAVVCAALAAIVLVPCPSVLAQESIDDQDAGQLQRRDDADSTDTSNINRPRLYPRAGYVWPYAEGPHYGDVPAIAIAEGLPGILVTPVGSFNLAQGRLPIPKELETTNRLGELPAQYFVVAMSNELDIHLETLAKIEAAGGVVVDHLGRGIVIARLTAAAYAAIDNAVGMMGIVPYHPALKLSPGIGREALPDPIKAMSDVYALDVMLWPGESSQAVAAEIAKLGANVTYVGGDQLGVEAQRDLLPRIAALEPVKIIYEALPVFAHAEETTTTMQTGQYNHGAIPYHIAGVNGGGSNFGVCANGTTVCQNGSEATNCTPPQSPGTCTPFPQILMVLDSGIQLDAGDLSHTSTTVGTVGPTHRKVLVYESTPQFGGQGDLLGCDAPSQGGFTHGHTVATTALGNATAVPAGYGPSWFAQDPQGNPWKLDGLAPRAKLIAYDGQLTPPTVSCADPLQDTISPGDLFDLTVPGSTALGKAYNSGARIINFSWGTTVNTYNANSGDIDTFLNNRKDALVFVSAGNNSQDTNNDGVPDPGTVGAPSTAKNALSIGASRNADTSNQPESREAFSSVGPAVNATTVNRISPQLMAPGGESGGGSLGVPSEFSCRSNDNDQSVPVQCDTIQGVEGTSFSAPAAAGAGLLVRDYFFQGFYPNRVPGVATAKRNVSGSLVKAALLASADFMTGANLTVPHRWNNEQGMGRIQLDNVLPLENWPLSPSGIIVHDSLNGVVNVSNLSLPATVASGASHSSTFRVCNDQEDLRIGFAYHDGAIETMRNNLNLQVTAPSGRQYRGNYFSDDNDRDGVPDLTEDCPGIGDVTANGQIDEGQWSLPVCTNTAIPGANNTPVTFDQTNVLEGIFLSPDADGNCSPTNNPAPGCYHDGTCTAGSNLGGVDGFGACGNSLDCGTGGVCDGGTKQPEIGNWTITISAGTPFTGGSTEFAVVLAGGVCVGSSVRFDRGFYTCNEGATVQVTELAEAFDAGCNAGSCPASTIKARTTVRAFDENDVEVDCEGPDCTTNPTAGLNFTQLTPQALIFESVAVNLTDGTVPQPGNGTLDIRDGYAIEVLYEDVNAAAQVVPRRSSATVGCQVAIGFGSIQFAQFGQDQSILVQGGCERAETRQGETQGFFEYGFPDRYMDADELIQFNFAFNSDETQDLDNVEAALRCVSTDTDSPADCLPNGSGCEPADCGGVCDPRRTNNPTCPWLDILDSPKFISRLPAGAAISANFAIQMKPNSLFGALTPTVEMLLEVSADTAGKTASGLAVSRQRLNIDVTETVYNTDYPTGGVGIVFDYNSNEVAENPITDLAGFQALDYRFETRSYGNLTAGLATDGPDVGTAPDPVLRNTNLQSPWNFDGGSGGFTNGLASVTDEFSAQSNLIWNFGEDKNFNGVQDGVCATNNTIACYVFPNDPRCPSNGICNSIENNAQDGFFTQNRNNRGGCGWQTLPPHTCNLDSNRGCYTAADCKGACQQTGNPILSTFTVCESSLECASVKQCSSTSSAPLAACTTDANCGGAVGSCQTVPQTCVGAVGPCNTGTTATKGGVWHTGRINDIGIGTCDGSPNSQCMNYKIITSTADTLVWWELLLTPQMSKVDQSESNGLANSRIELGYWAWNQAANLRDVNVAYSWEFDTDVEAIVPVDLVGDATALDFAVGAWGAVINQGNPGLVNGFSLFAPMGECSGGDGACRITEECPAGTCSGNSNIDCHFDSTCVQASAGTCNGEETCLQQTLTQNGTDVQGNNRKGKNSCFFEGTAIPAVAFAETGLALPRDDDFDADGDTLIDEFVTQAGPIRNSDIVAFNGPDMRFFTLEDIFGDTGNRFQGALGMVNFEGDGDPVTTPSFGLAVDDMYVEWKEFTLDPDQTSCDSGSCAVIELPTTNLFQGNNVLEVSLLEATPYNFACVSGGNNGDVCFDAAPNCPSGSCLPTFNDCDLDGVFNETGDDSDCNDNGTDDVVVRASSEADTEGVILVLDRQGTGFEYRADLTVSLLAKSPGVLFLAQNGDDSPTITVTYLDLEDGTGHRCQNSVVPEQQGLVQAVTTAFIPDCDIELAASDITDNGDHDSFADTDETIALSFSVRNNCDIELTGCSARLSTNSEHIECILNPVVALGTIPFDVLGTPFPSPQAFQFKISNGADRASLSLDAEDELAAPLTISFNCNQIDANSFPQGLSLQLDLNLSDLGQTPFQWKEDFESPGSLGKFTPQNLDAGIPGQNNIDGLTNGDDWRCQYNNPDWVLGTSYGHALALNCFPGVTLAQADAVFWQQDGNAATHSGPKRAYRGTGSMYYGVFLTLPAGEFSTPMSIVEAVRTPSTINLGVDDPKLSFWHQVTLADHRFVAPVPPLRSADRGVVQIQIADSGGNPNSVWTTLQPVQNSYDEQAVDNFFNCTFDPIDDGNNEDDFFDPTDPNRDDGPSSTCFPNFSYGFNGDTDDDFNVGLIGNADTPPLASDSPSLGPGTWVETVIDLSEFRGRRARLRFLTSAIKGSFENWEAQFGDNPVPEDDGWWIDDVVVDEVLTNPAQIVIDNFDVGTCSISGAPCVGQCSLNPTIDCGPTTNCGVGNGTCVSPCPTGQTCSGPPPSCGAACSSVVANVVAETESQTLVNPVTINTAAPGQVVSFNAADPGSPSSANSCVSGTLQYQFCISVDPDGGGGGVPDADCLDVNLPGDLPEDEILRGWTENPTMSSAPQASSSYVTEVRCSTEPACASSRKIDVNVQCPGGVNALGLSDVRGLKGPDPSAVPPLLAGEVRFDWNGTLNVRTWKGGPFDISSDFQNYPGVYGNLNSASHHTVAAGSDNPPNNQFFAYLYKATGTFNHQSIESGYFCNSRTWRSGGTGEYVPENPPTCVDGGPTDDCCVPGSEACGRDEEMTP